MPIRSPQGLKSRGDPFDPAIDNTHTLAVMLPILPRIQIPPHSSKAMRRFGLVLETIIEVGEGFVGSVISTSFLPSPQALHRYLPLFLFRESLHEDCVSE